MATHANIATFVGICLEPDHFSMLMEYCPRGSLQVISASQAPFSQRFKDRSRSGSNLKTSIFFIVYPHRYRHFTVDPNIDPDHKIDPNFDPNIFVLYFVIVDFIPK
jgi:hypothetical protein